MSESPPFNYGHGWSDPYPNTPNIFNPDLPPPDPEYIRMLQEAATSYGPPPYIPLISLNDLGPVPCQWPGTTQAQSSDTSFYSPTLIASGYTSSFATAPGSNAVSAIPAGLPQVQGPVGNTRRQQSKKSSIPGTSEFRISPGPDSSDSMQEYKMGCKCNKTFQKPMRHWKKSCIYNPNRDGRAICDICGVQITNRRDNLVRHKHDIHGVIIDE